MPQICTVTSVSRSDSSNIESIKDRKISTESGWTEVKLAALNSIRIVVHPVIKHYA